MGEIQSYCILQYYILVQTVTTVFWTVKLYYKLSIIELIQMPIFKPALCSINTEAQAYRHT
jgi:hypothetical protein